MEITCLDANRTPIMISGDTVIVNRPLLPVPIIDAKSTQMEDWAASFPLLPYHTRYVEVTAIIKGNHHGLPGGWEMMSRGGVNNIIWDRPQDKVRRLDGAPDHHDTEFAFTRTGPAAAYEVQYGTGEVAVDIGFILGALAVTAAQDFSFKCVAHLKRAARPRVVRECAALNVRVSQRFCRWRMRSATILSHVVAVLLAQVNVRVDSSTWPAELPRPGPSSTRGSGTFLLSPSTPVGAGGGVADASVLPPVGTYAIPFIIPQVMLRVRTEPAELPEGWEIRFEPPSWRIRGVLVPQANMADWVADEELDSPPASPAPALATGEPLSPGPSGQGLNLAPAAAAASRLLRVTMPKLGEAFIKLWVMPEDDASFAVTEIGAEDDRPFEVTLSRPPLPDLVRLRLRNLQFVC